MSTVTRAQSIGHTCVTSAERPECHGPSYFRHSDYSAKPAANGVTPRERQRSMILAFWESQGVARYNRRAGGVWEVRDVVNSQCAGEWYPLASQGEDVRSDMAVFSHVVSAANGGAWCGGNVVPEVGAFNHARGEVDMVLSPTALSVLAAWPAWWARHYARPASLTRLGM